MDAQAALTAFTASFAALRTAQTADQQAASQLAAAQAAKGQTASTLAAAGTQADNDLAVLLQVLSAQGVVPSTTSTSTTAAPVTTGTPGS